MKIALPVLMLSISTTAVAETPDRFNLVCVGVMTRKFEGVTSPQLVYTSTMRVDLTKRLWCVEQCDSPLPIANISDTDLILQQTDAPDATSFIALNRRSGELLQGLTLHPQGGNGKKMDVSIVAQCNPAPFIEMPAKKF